MLEEPLFATGGVADMGPTEEARLLCGNQETGKEHSIKRLYICERIYICTRLYIAFTFIYIYIHVFVCNNINT